MELKISEKKQLILILITLRTEAKGWKKTAKGSLALSKVFSDFGKQFVVNWKKDLF